MTCWVTFLLLLISSKRINERNFEKIKVRFVLFLCLHIWWNEVVNGLFLIVHGWTHKTRVSIGSNICVLKNNIRSHCITLNIFSSHIHTSNASSHYHHHPATNIHGSISLTVRFKLEREGNAQLVIIVDHQLSLKVFGRALVQLERCFISTFMLIRVRTNTNCDDQSVHAHRKENLSK